MYYLQIGAITALMNTNLRLGQLKHCLDAVNATVLIYAYELGDGMNYYLKFLKLFFRDFLFKIIMNYLLTLSFLHVNQTNTCSLFYFISSY